MSMKMIHSLFFGKKRGREREGKTARKYLCCVCVTKTLRFGRAVRQMALSPESQQGGIDPISLCVCVCVIEKTYRDW